MTKLNTVAIAAPIIPYIGTRIKFAIKLQEEPIITDQNKPLVFFDARKAAAKKPACDEKSAETVNNGTYCHAIKKSFEYKNEAIGLAKIITKTHPITHT